MQWDLMEKLRLCGSQRGTLTQPGVSGGSPRRKRKREKEEGEKKDEREGKGEGKEGQEEELPQVAGGRQGGRGPSGSRAELQAKSQTWALQSPARRPWAAH